MLVFAIIRVSASEGVDLVNEADAKIATRKKTRPRQLRQGSA